MSDDAYTRPEKFAARSQAKSVGAIIRENGGCCYCKHRTHAFETLGKLGACGLSPPKVFPACVESTRHGFDFDEAAYRGHVEG